MTARNRGLIAECAETHLIREAVARERLYNPKTAGGYITKEFLEKLRPPSASSNIEKKKRPHTAPPNLPIRFVFNNVVFPETNSFLRSLEKI